MNSVWTMDSPLPPPDFNKIAQVWSAYESHNTPTCEIIDRGIYSFQLAEMEGSWEIANVLWNSETEDYPATGY